MGVEVYISSYVILLFSLCWIHGNTMEKCPALLKNTLEIASVCQTGMLSQPCICALGLSLK